MRENECIQRYVRRIGGVTLDFNKFKESYNAKLDKLGATERPSEDRLAELYIGLVIFSEWQAEEIKRASEVAAKETAKLNKKIAHSPKIYTGGRLQ